MRFSGLSGAIAIAPGLGLFSAVSAALLHVTSYAGTLTTLNLGLIGTEGLQTLTTSTECGTQPSWLTLRGPVLYCANEAFGKDNGTLASFSVSQNGTLALLDKVDTIGGPVNAVVYGKGCRGLAVADYAGAGLNTFNITNPKALAPVQADVFTLPHPGINPSRQEKPHPHQAILDPSGKFLLVPDLGSDLVRVFALNVTTLRYKQLDPLVSAPGSGPRHGAFLVSGNNVFLYIVHELANTIVGYTVNYTTEGLAFAQVYISNTHGLGETPAISGATAGEIAISPDSRFLIISSRGEGTLSVPNFDPSNSTQLSSDPLITFSIDPKTGALAHVQTFAAGGMVPRHFSLNKAGSLVGVALQGSERAVVISRDPATGLLKDFVASVTIAGEVNNVIFNE
ncbi:Lactonase, 7-bladed beta-propeller-domain-containing protein [Lasiosphaeria ovina]|uniref:Lactonase, 7-bladed beta-propeller-domain-containing protein n=1 Tax=Lasiosphaeria ovina TaxID=92902 RepID=A0AAE0NE99_9PEZI|nr:Lactonase, 7-bladed beta-propeller-domain-containing protein [Lasiosphaeria ovina]